VVSVTSELIGGFGWNFYGGDNVADDIDTILLNLLASTIPKWRTFNLLKWEQLLNLLMDLDYILYGGDGIEIVYCKLM
jgi:hypothetical protein